MNNFNFLVNPTDLAKNDGRYLIIDCRKRSEYDSAHIKGALPLPIDYWLKENNEDHIARGENIISYEHFITVMSKIGASNDSDIVVYDDNEGRGATRFWFVAKYYGHQNVSVLNGGWKNYLQSKLPKETIISANVPFSYYVPQISEGFIITLDELINNYNDYKIIDARSDDEWTGKDMHGNPRGGHLVNAVHINWEKLSSSDTSNTFINNDQIISIVQASGINMSDNIVTYCQAGIRAAHVAFALLQAGYPNVLIYDGSMYQWSRRNSLILEK